MTKDHCCGTYRLQFECAAYYKQCVNIHTSGCVRSSDWYKGCRCEQLPVVACTRVSQSISGVE